MTTSTAAADAQLCEVKVFGDEFHEPLECIRSETGKDYKGTLNITIDGDDCLPWYAATTDEFSIETFPEVAVEDANNYCRRTSSRQKPFCWVLDESGAQVRKTCNLMACDTACRRRADGTDYLGVMADTKVSPGDSAPSCLHWSYTLMKRTSDFSADENSNINRCRNPGRTQERAWCYTNSNTSMPTSSRYCHVPQCPTSSRMDNFRLDLHNDSDIEQLRNITENMRECFRSEQTIPRKPPIYDYVMQSLCRNHDGSWKLLNCHYTNDASRYGDGAMWARLFILCATEEETTTSSTTSTAAETSSTYSSSTLLAARGGLCATRCSYSCGNTTATASLEELQVIIQNLQRELLLNTDTLSKTVRKKKSIYDSRPSSTASGTVAIALLCAVIGCLVGGDVVSAAMFLKDAWSNYFNVQRTA